jgi:hypothetical protein
MSNGWYPSWANVQSLGRLFAAPVPAYVPLNEFVAPLELTPEEKAWEASGYKEPSRLGEILTGISGFINSTFPNVLSAITGRPIATAAAPAGAKAAPKTLAQYVPELLLVAGVAVLGVVGAVMLFGPHGKK